MGKSPEAAALLFTGTCEVELEVAARPTVSFIKAGSRVWVCVWSGWVVGGVCLCEGVCVCVVVM